MQSGWAPAAFIMCLCAACSKGSGDTSAVLPLVTGARLYAQNCVPCHRDDGRGVPTIYPSLAGSPVVNGDAVDLAKWVLNGQRPASMPAGRYSTQMLQFSWMNDADGAALLSYVRGNFGNQSSSIDTASIARARGH